MLPYLTLMLGLMFQSPGGIIVDRIAVVVGKHAIKTSEIDRDVRVTAFLNRASPDLSPEARHKAAERLIDQSIIRDEIALGGYNRASDSDVDTMLKQIREERYGSSNVRMLQDLTRYGLNEAELREQLRWQMTVLRFIDARFSPAVLVSDESVRAYYDQHLTELKRQYPRDYSFPAHEPIIRDLVRGQEVNKQFEAWLQEARQNQHIEYRQEALG